MNLFTTERVMLSTVVIVTALVLALVPLLGLNSQETLALLALAVVGVSLRVVLIRAQMRWGWARLAPIVVPLNVLLITLAFAVVFDSLHTFWILYFILSPIAALIYGARWALVSGLLSAIGYLSVEIIKGMMAAKPAECLLNAAALLLFAIVAELLAGNLRRRRLELDRMHVATAENAHRLALLNEFAALVNRGLDLKTLLADAQRLVVELVQLKTAWIVLRNDIDELALAADHNLPAVLAADDKREMRWRPCRCQRMLLAGELTESVNIVECERFERAGVKAHHATVPLKSGDIMLGLVNVVTQSGESLPPEDLQTLGAMAAQLGVAIERARLHEQVKARRIEEQAHLLRLSQGLSGLLDTDAILDRAAEAVQEMLRPTLVSLMLPDDRREHLILRAGRGWEKEMYGTYSVDIATLREGYAFTTGEAVTSPPTPWPPPPSPDSDAVRQERGIGGEVSLTAPLNGEHGTLGTLCAHFREPRAFGDDDVRLLSLIANQTAVACERARHHYEALVHIGALTTLNQLAERISSTIDLDTLLQTIADSARELAHAQYAALGIANADGRITQFITSGMSAEERARIDNLPQGRGLLGALIREGKSLRVRDISQDPRSVGFPPHHPPMTSFLGVLILSKGQIVGDLYLTNKIGAAEFSAHDQTLVETLAAQAAIAIENARLFSQAEERLQRISALHDIDVAITSELTLEETLNVLLEKTSERLRVDAAAVALIEPETRALNYAARSGFDGEFFRDGLLKVKEGIVGQVAHSGEPMAIVDVSQEPRFVRRPIAEKLGIVSYLAVALRAHGEIIGVLELATRARHDFLAEEVAFFETLAGQAAIAIEKARLFDETRAYVRDLEKMNTIVQSFQQISDLATLYARITESVARLLQAEQCAVILFNEAEEAFVMQTPAFGITEEQARAFRVPLADSERFWKSMPTGQPYAIVNAPARDARVTPQFVETFRERSLLTTRLLVADKLVGAIRVANKTPGAGFSEREGRLLATLTPSVAIAIENARLVQQIEQQLTELSLLYQISQQVQQVTDVADLFPLLLEQTLNAMQAQAGTLFLRDGTEPRLRVAAARGYPAPADDLIVPFGQGLAGRVMLTGKADVSQDLEKDARLLRPDHFVNLHAGVCVPLMTSAGLVGAVMICFADYRPISENQIRLLTTIAATAASALQRTRLFEETRLAAQQFGLLYDAGLTLNSVLEPRAMIDFLLKIASKTVQADRAGFFRYDPARQVLTHETGSGLEEQVNVTALHAATFAMGEERGLVGIAAAGRVPLYVPDVQADPRWIKFDNVAHSALWVPVRHEDQLLGVLSVISTRVNAFSPADQRLVGLFANQLAVAMEDARLFNEARNRANEFAALYETTRDLTVSHDLASLLKTIVDRASALLNTPTGSVYLYDANSKTLELVVAKGFEKYSKARLELKQGVTGWVAETKQPLIVNDYRIWEHRSPQFDNVGFSAVLGVPMLYGGELVGTVGVGEIGATTRQFTESDARLLELFATQAAAAVHNARLFEAERAARLQAETLRQVAHDISGTLKLDEVLRVVLEQLRRVIVYDTASVLLLGEGDAPALVAGVGYADEKMTSGEARDLLKNSSILREMARTLKTVIIPDVRQNPDWIWVPGAEQVRSFLCAPIIAQGRMVGALMMDRARVNFYNETDAQIALALASHLAVAMENARLFEETRQRAEQLALLYRVGQTLNSTLETEAILADVIDEAMRVTGAACGCMLVVDEESNRFVYRALRGFTPELAEKTLTTPLSLDQGLNGRAYRTRETIVLDDARASPEYLEFIPTTRTELVIPMIRSGKVLGNIDLQSPRVGAFRGSDIGLLKALADQAAIALENARLFQETARRADEFAALFDTTRDVASQLELSVLLQSIVDRATQLLAAPMGAMMLFDSASDDFQVAVTKNFPVPVGTRIARGAGMTGRVAETLQPLLINDYPSWEYRLPQFVQAGITAVLGVPMTYRGELIGVLSVNESNRARQFTQGDARLLTLFAAQAASAVRSARLFEAERSRRAELGTLYDLSRALADTNDFDTILALVTRAAIETIHITLARAALVEGDEFVLRALHPARTLAETTLATREPVSAHPFYQRALLQNAPAVVRAADPAIGDYERPILFPANSQTLCLIPLRAGERALGLLLLNEARGEARESFTAEKINLARSIGDQAASALHRAELFAQLEQSYLETVLALANAVDAKDMYTADHAQRLAQMALAVGREMGMTARELEELRYGAILHDVGKIGIPDAILKKPGKLDADEWKIMRQHPEIGARILAPIPRLADASKIVRHHHERFDGKGYPDGLTGESIPLGARILTVVDSFSAIMDARVYKVARPENEAIAELKKHAGTQFDPRVVEIFLRLIERGLDITGGGGEILLERQWIPRLDD